MRANTAKRLLALESAKSPKPIKIVVIGEDETAEQAQARGQLEYPRARLIIVNTGIQRAPKDPM